MVLFFLNIHTHTHLWLFISVTMITKIKYKTSKKNRLKGKILYEDGVLHGINERNGKLGGIFAWQGDIQVLI